MTDREKLKNIFDQNTLNYYFNRSDGTLVFTTHYKEYNVYLMAMIDKNREDIQSFMKTRAGFDSIPTKNGKVIQDVCGGAYGCYGAIIGSDLYYIVMDIASTQPVPDNLDGIWAPDHNITQDQIRGMLTTLEPAGR